MFECVANSGTCVVPPVIRTGVTPVVDELKGKKSEEARCQACWLDIRSFGARDLCGHYELGQGELQAALRRSGGVAAAKRYGKNATVYFAQGVANSRQGKKTLLPRYWVVSSPMKVDVNCAGETIKQGGEFLLYSVAGLDVGSRSCFESSDYLEYAVVVGGRFDEDPFEYDFFQIWRAALHAMVHATHTTM